MTIERLNVDIAMILKSFKVAYKPLDLFKTIATVYEVPDFGLILCGINPLEYGQVATTLSSRYEGYRIIYVTTEDTILEKKQEVLWELMRSGYITYLRSAYPRQFNELVRFENLDRRIVDKRLELWGTQAKYKWLVEENMAAKNESSTYILSINPAFYDYMPD